MPSEDYDLALARAAEGCGVEPRFWDIFGREHAASRETLRAIVEALGICAKTSESMHAALQAREHTEWTRALAPSIVLTYQSGHISFPVTLPREALRGKARFRVHLEAGGTLDAEFSLWQAEIEESKPFDSGWTRVTIDLPLDVPLGYHELELEAGATRAKAKLIVSPQCAFEPDAIREGGKSAGIAVALYGLRSARNWGFGDFTDLRTLCTWAAQSLGVSFVALNPLHAIANRRPYNTSPYLPISIFFQNLLYLDIEAIDEWNGSKRAQDRFAAPETQRELHLLRESPEVEYERVQDLKLQFLKLLFEEFLRRHWRRNSPRAAQFRAFQKEAGELLTRFALYCALNERLHAANPDLWIWTEWPLEYRNPQSPKVEAFAKKHWRLVLFYQYTAWQTSEQLAGAQKHALNAGLSIGLYHDLALATDRFGSDIWAHREFFAPGCRVGSPPDDFSPQGQDWGFPPPNTIRHREDGYHLFRESIRRTCQYGGALRIDHVMRFFRLYWIPDGMDATQGAYVQDRARDLVRIVALESVRNRVLVVGEDLGTVEPYIREMLAQYGILSYRLFYFERASDGSYRRAEQYPRQALVSSTTHDLPTLTGFWNGTDIEARRAAGMLDEAGHRAQWDDRMRDKQRMLELLAGSGLLPDGYPREASQSPEMSGSLHDAIIRFLASTPSMLMVVNQEDLTLETHQQNLPGTTSQYPNWGRKMRFTLEQLDLDAEARELTRRMREQLQASGRANRRTPD
jgi:4-alpha-glucanotransferase